ncbi:unnamed protein product [marine sediment metagenome]|uniref:Uncharacterized protein n=1 Tax=marine sediment metagenome TaxID=412755 RepID=X1AQR3_9ZZZZ
MDDVSDSDISAGVRNTNNGTNPSGMRARTRNNTGFSQLSMPDGIAPWEKVQQIIQDDEVAKGVKSDHRKTFSGVWKIPSPKDVLRRIYDKIVSLRKQTVEKVEDFSSESTFAIITFTSRQAAIAGKFSYCFHPIDRRLLCSSHVA